jgi:hypothetical protein
MLALPDFDHLDPSVTGQELVVVLIVVGEWRPQPAHRDHDDPHG